VFPSCLPQNPSRARAGNRHWSAATHWPAAAHLFGRLSVSPSVRPSVRRLYYPPGPGAGYGHIYRLGACRKMPQFRFHAECNDLYVRPRVLYTVPFDSCDF
jgi:hypothetical protein